LGRPNFCPAKKFVKNSFTDIEGTSQFKASKFKKKFRLGFRLTSKKNWPSLSENIDKIFFFQFKLFDDLGGQRAGGIHSGSNIKKNIFCHEF
jgi:hypothetical protein